jgi:Zn-dependent peptidase ImmA (M78 family)/DNA-binding XRE family transcriptional regulator
MIGERIQQARKAAGLSLRALAEKTGVTAMAISKYENGQSTPSSGVLLALAKALGLRTEYFFRRVSVELENVNHRHHEQLPEREEKKVLADVREQLERWLELEEVAPAPWSFSFSLPKGLPKSINSYDDIEEVAVKMRRHWDLGLNPVTDLIDTLESKGIKVLITQYDGHKHFNGLSARLNKTPVIVVGKHWTGDRQRFTLGHELGHIVLHGLLDGSLDEEIACNRFAGAFLVPNESVINSLGERRTRLELQELYLLKQEWGLSMMAWSYRAKDLKVIPDSTNKLLWSKYMRHWKAKGKEPGEQFPAEKTRLFKQLVYRALAEDRLSESKAAELLGMSVIDFHACRKMECPHDVAHQ